MESTAEVVIHKKKQPRFTIWPAVALAVVFFLVMIWYGISFRHWTGLGTSLFTRFIPIPAATVNGSMITYYQVVERTRILAWLNHNSEDDSSLFTKAIHALVEQKAIEQIASQKKVSLERSDVDETLSALQGNLESKEFEQKVKTELNMNISRFKTLVVEPLALAQKLDSFVENDSDTQEVVKLKANEALARLKNGESFSSIAALYSLDPSFSQGGDVGYLSSDTIPKGWEILLDLDEEELSPVIETDEAIEIVMAAWVVSSGENKQIRTQAIVIKKLQLEDLVEEYLSESTIKYFVDGDFVL